MCNVILIMCNILILMCVCVCVMCVCENNEILLMWVWN